MSAVSVLLAPSDEAFGERIADALARRGLAARLIAGDQAEILAGDDLGADASIVVWSAAAMRLADLHKQARAALENGALIPVAIEGATAPEGFENLPPVDLSDWTGDDDYPRWRFVLEALAIASEYRQGDDRDQTPADPSVEVARSKEVVVLPPAFEKTAIETPVVSTPFLATDMVDSRLPLFPVTRKAPRRVPTLPTPKAKSRRFDPGAVAAAGVMTMCLITGAAIIMAPSFLPPSETALPSTSEAPATTPAPTQRPMTQRIELSMLAPVLAPPLKGDGFPFESDGMEGYGEGDISYPEDEIGAPGADPLTDSHADEIHLAMLGPVVPPDEIIAPLGDQSAASAAYPRSPSLKPVGPMRAAAQASIDALLADVPELTDQAGVTSSAGGATVAGDHFTDCATCPDMVALSAGAFVMGPGADERSRPNEGPARNIEFARSFAIAAREVTFAEWDACVADGGCADHEAYDFGWGRGDQPVVGVSFADAQNYAAWLSAKTGHAYRLPSEAEWEYAARAGQSTPFSFGDDLSATQANYDGRFVYQGRKSRWVGHPTPASRYPANAFGLFDMHGNVWEWTADCWRMSLDGAPTDGSPRGGTCVTRVLKGGAFNTGGWRLRAAHRIGKPASTREMEIGFRVVRALD